MTTILSMDLSTDSSMRISSRVSRPSVSRRPSRVSATACGWSWISLSMKEEAALLRGRGVPVDLELLPLDEVALDIRDRDLIGGDRHDLVLADLDGRAGVVDEGGDVGAEEVLALAEADDQR